MKIWVGNFCTFSRVVSTTPTAALFSKIFPILLISLFLTGCLGGAGGGAGGGGGGGGGSGGSVDYSVLTFDDGVSYVFGAVPQATTSEKDLKITLSGV